MKTEERNKEYEDVLKFLEMIGIKGYESRAYLALLSLGEATASQVASKAKIPLTRVYEVLESLVNKGLAEVRVGRPKAYRAIHPSIALNLYLRSYIDGIVSEGRRIISKLSSLYKTSREEGLSIWISGSFSASIEKARELINKLSIDGFMAASDEILNKLVDTLYVKLISSESSLFTITLTFEPHLSKSIEKLEKIPNLDIRVLPTSVLRAIEVDFSKALIFGRSYALFTTEHELIMILNESFYHGNWRLAKRFKGFDVKKGITYKSRHHWLILELINDGLKLGLNVRAKIVGVNVRDRRNITVEGYVCNVNTEDFIRNFTIELSNGEKLVIGGINASIEDVEARYIEVVFE